MEGMTNFPLFYFRRTMESARIAAWGSYQIDGNFDESCLPDLAKYVETDEAMKWVLEYLLQTKVGTFKQLQDINIL